MHSNVTKEWNKGNVVKDLPETPATVTNNDEIAFYNTQQDIDM